MLKITQIPPRIIVYYTYPKCVAEYIGVHALSRIPELGCICPDCGCREALESIGISKEEQEKIIGIIHSAYIPKV